MFWDIANICPLQILPILIAQGLASFVKTIGILISCLFQSYRNPQRQSVEPLPTSHGWKWVSVDGYRNSRHLSKSNFGRVQRTVITFFFSKMLSVCRGIWRWKHSTSQNQTSVQQQNVYLIQLSPLIKQDSNWMSFRYYLHEYQWCGEGRRCRDTEVSICQRNTCWSTG